MAISSEMPHVEDVYSVGSRVSWSAILAGAAVALAIQFLLGILTATIWAAVNDDGNSSVANARPYFAILVACVALFVGGFVTSRLTAGENQTEALLYGLVTWAAVVAIMAHGVTAGHEMLQDVRNPVTARANNDWETPARNAGLTQEQIAEIRAKMPANSRKDSEATASPEARRALWFTFAGIWLSMAAAAAGAFVGAGPNFRLAVRTRTTVAGVQ